MVAQPRLSRRVRRRRRVFALALVALVVIVAVVVRNVRQSDQYTTLHEGSTTFLVPRYPDLSPLRARIVAIAESQIGYSSDPSNTYCNKFSAYWQSGTENCGNDNLDEEWCADFAAWAWKQAGATVNYQYLNGDLNSSSASFYEWGEAHGTWHPVGSGYVPQPGDVAVYGLDTATLIAAHVAVVVGDERGARGPIAVNGDGDLTGFSRVEVQTDEYDADVHPRGAPLSGYVAPS
jgi:hypothetical protein